MRGVWLLVSLAVVVAGVVSAVVVWPVGEGEEAVEGETAVAVAVPATAPPLCAQPWDPTCIRVVHRGAPEDYADVSDIPARAIIERDVDGRYLVERGQQITVVTAAVLPAGYSRFYLQPRAPEERWPIRAERTIPPDRTTYTFRITTAESGFALVTLDLRAGKPPRQTGSTRQLGDTVVTTEFLVPSFHYFILTTRGTAPGIAAKVGRYAFRREHVEAAGVRYPRNYGHSQVVELRIHSVDADGASRAAFYDTVQVGDSVDYRTDGLDCGYRFRVTSVGAAAATRTFGLEYVNRYGPTCAWTIPETGVAQSVHFVWKVLPGAPGPDGMRVLLPREPVGEGTYRIFPGTPCVIDVPAGMQVTQIGYYFSVQTAQDPIPTHTPPGPRGDVTLSHDATGSFLAIDPGKCRELRRYSRSPRGGCPVRRDHGVDPGRVGVVREGLAARQACGVGARRITAGRGIVSSK